MKVKTLTTKTVAKKVVKPVKKTAVKAIKKVAKTVVKPTAKKAVVLPTKSVVISKAVKSVVKTVNKTAAKKPLVYADNQRSFWVSNGQVLNSLIALRDALDAMENEVYLYHAGEAHNDFANWVSDVLCDTTCASDLNKAKTLNSARTAVVKNLKTYKI
ncbi:MAG: hypothetical protein RLZZ230_225 [Candidatus Parcubacteria bacterium]|jgi:hypothetical protein